MSYLKLAIIDEKGKETEPEALTDIGRGLIVNQCRELISELEDLDRKEKD
jgi:hypothetical protein